MRNTNTKLKSGADIILEIVLAFIFTIIELLAVGYVIMALWNVLLPEIASFSSITYLQALGLYLLLNTLFLPLCRKKD